MPLYAYECENCGVRFDRRQGFNDEPIRLCPECEGPVHRLIQPAGVIFKGSGFYSTDHKSGSSASASSNASKDKAAADKSGASEGKPAAASDGKAESKPAKPAPKSAPASPSDS